ncbi:MAG TPA: restriction endonuclease subunit S [Clostridiales bacterium]|nr:restriction endonuclease subunit S [Clostridiales bacterium]
MVTYPKDWEEKKLNNYVHIYQGGTPSTANKSYWDGNIVWVTPSDVTKQAGMYIYNSERKITEKGLCNSSAKLLPEGTILLCTRATIGELVIAGRPLATNQGFKNLVCKENADSLFLAYLLGTLKDEMLQKASGTTFLELSSRELSKINITMPPLPEQQGIADTLSTFDEHIENLTKLIEKKRAIRDGALEDLVTGKVRLDGFQSSWKQIQFSDVIVPKARIGWQGLKKDEYLPQGYSYLIGGTDFEKGKISLENISYVSKQRYEMDVNIQVSAGDVLVTKDGTIGKVAVVPEMNKPATLSSGVFVFRVKRGLESSYLYWVLMSSLFSKFIEELSAGSTIKHLYQKDLKKFEFEMPSDVEEQQAIASILTAMDDELIKLEHEREKIQQIKAGAMDDLLTGKIRLV